MVQVGEERNTISNGVKIAFDTIGDPHREPLLLVHGLGAQLIAWDLQLCELLADRGYFIIRFDNRDVGHSTRFSDHGIPDLTEFLGALVGTPTPEPPYTLRDMAADAVAVMDALEVERAHVLGISMGGMIAQLLAIHYPERVCTLTSIMSSTMEPNLGIPDPEAMEVLVQPPATSLEEHIERELGAAQILKGPRYPLNEAYIRRRASANWRRGLSADGTARQLAAVLGSGSRREALADLRLPALIIHGDSDPLIKVEAGKATAEAIPGAELCILEGVGHMIPEEIQDELVDVIAQHAR